MTHEGTSDNDIPRGDGGVPVGDVPVGGGEEAECEDEGEEDADEDEVCAEREEHVEEAEDAHPEGEETCVLLFLAEGMDDLDLWVFCWVFLVLRSRGLLGGVWGSEGVNVPKEALNPTDCNPEAGSAALVA